MFGNTIKVKSKDELSDLIKFIVKYRDINADLNFKVQRGYFPLGCF